MREDFLFSLRVYYEDTDCLGVVYNAQYFAFIERARTEWVESMGISIADLNQNVTLSGWVDTIRDHGNLLFIDLRDNYGITQCVVDGQNKLFEQTNIFKHSCDPVISFSNFFRSSS